MNHPRTTSFVRCKLGTNRHQRIERPLAATPLQIQPSSVRLHLRRRVHLCSSVPMPPPPEPRLLGESTRLLTRLRHKSPLPSTGGTREARSESVVLSGNRLVEERFSTAMQKICGHSTSRIHVVACLSFRKPNSPTSRGGTTRGGLAQQKN